MRTDAFRWRHRCRLDLAGELQVPRAFTRVGCLRAVTSAAWRMVAGITTAVLKLKDTENPCYPTVWRMTAGVVTELSSAGTRNTCHPAVRRVVAGVTTELSSGHPEFMSFKSVDNGCWDYNWTVLGGHSELHVKCLLGWEKFKFAFIVT